jgi:ABC-type branched-subunit amino acid transport system substrate-binding protein
MREIFFLGLIAALATGTFSQAFAQKNYGPGVSDTEIKIGQTMPYSGPASSLSAIGKGELAYFKMINAKGGINGRKINLISLDDGFSPPKTVEQTRKLVEEDNVLAIVNTMGTAGNTAIAKYLNAKKVPQLLVASSSVKLNDAPQFPWTTTFFLLQSTEARIFAHWLLKNRPDAKIGVLYQNDDFGKGYVEGLRHALGDKAKVMIVKEVSHELTDPTVDSQITMLRAEGVDTLFYASLPKATIQAIRRVQDLNWHPYQLVGTASTATLLQLDKGALSQTKHLYGSLYMKSPDDPRWANDKGMMDYRAFMAEWVPGEPVSESGYTMGYSVAELFSEIVRRAGNDLSRENLLKQATNVKGFQLSLFLPGITIEISPNDRSAWRNAQIVNFQDGKWLPIGELVSAGDLPTSK